MKTLQRLWFRHWYWFLPLVWSLVTVAGYFWFLKILDDHGERDWNNALSAAQVFTGIAGFGAGVVAILAVREQFRPQTARLAIMATRGSEPGSVRIEIRNDGSVAAETAAIVFVGAPHGSVTIPKGLSPGWTSRSTSQGEDHALIRTALIPAYSQWLSVAPGDIFIPDETSELCLTCANGEESRIPVPAQQKPTTH